MVDWMLVSKIEKGYIASIPKKVSWEMLVSNTYTEQCYINYKSIKKVTLLTFYLYFLSIQTIKKDYEERCEEHWVVELNYKSCLFTTIQFVLVHKIKVGTYKLRRAFYQTKNWLLPWDDI